MNAPATGTGRYDLVAVGDPVLDIVIRGSRLPRWDDKQLGASAQRFAGGTEANAACAASRLGLAVAMFGSLGDGPEGGFLLSELQRYGVGCGWLSRRSGVSTATAIVYVADGGERAITFVPARDTADRSDQLGAMLRSTRCVYTVPYDAAALDRLAAAARGTGTELAVDIERAVVAAPGVWTAVAGSADLMFFNESGFFAVAGRAATIEAAQALRRTTRARVLVVTLGALGALAVDDQGRAALQGAYRARVVDATGAGDCFNGAFLAAHLRGADLQAALAQGCAAACLCVEATGARAVTLSAQSVAEVQQSRTAACIAAELEARP
ncbi:MAG TPA: carbohydrate kinase family protein [Methylibium sp.]|uniref:carbohydrate kinase family protein n=1 Tax=Methylibium sp. TaxID=2067992 RepID=UPI002DBC7FB0|nr:carbohydrate kinase family protein [Methylibium sp.]HEU4460272.1 carbohydrate kinase family protein [Methylibium sp.]